jgi:phosphatidylinositol glycan class B
VILAAIVFSITAYFSYGFHHFDEHFQIFEFAGVKLGINQQNLLSWEYDAQIRSAFQPCIVVVLVKAMTAIGIVSPFTWAFVIRLLTGLFSLACIFFSCSILSRQFLPQNRKLFILLSYFLYFIPYIAVRFSSETIGSCFFLLGFSLLIGACDKSKAINHMIWLCIGILWGLSFISRFQCGIMIIGGIAWLILIYRLSFSRVLLIGSGIAVVIGLGMFIDHWFYGQWVLTSWNYLRTTLMDDEAVKFGTSPWHYYLSELYQGDAKSAIKLIVLLGSIHFLYKNPKDIISFIVVPFVLIHILIGHKEMRFMIPVAFFTPYITIAFWQYLTQKSQSEWSANVQRLIVYQALFINMISLAVNTFKPADGQPLVYQYLYDRYGTKPHHIYYMEKGGNFFWAQALLPMNFYNPANSPLSRINEQEIIKRSTDQKEENVVIADRKIDLSKLPLKAIYASKPDWLLLLDLNDWMRMKNNDWVVYKIVSAKSANTHETASAD